MMDDRMVERVFERMGRTQLWAVLDAARDGGVYRLVESAANACCLYAGELPWELARAAPYLVELPDGDFARRLIRSAWGNSWGIFFRTEATIATLRKHLRTFLRVTDRRGRRLVFRYYDPRVMRVYLPTCTAAEARAVFGPIDSYFMESDDADAVLRFDFRKDTLEAATLPLSGTGTIPDAGDSRTAVPGI